MKTNQPFCNLAILLAAILSLSLALLSTLPSSASGQVIINPEPGALKGGHHGHSVTFRQATPAFGPIDSIDDAAILLSSTLPNGDVAFEALGNGTSAINFTDTNSNPRPQQNFGSDRDIRRVAGSLFGPGDQDNYAARFTGYIYIPNAGSWNFTVNSDEGFRLRMGTANGVVLESPYPKLPGNVTGAVPIPSSGFYHYELIWFERTGGSEIEFFANGPGQPTDRLVGDASGTLQVFQTLSSLEHLNLSIQSISRSNVLLLWTNANVVLEEASSLTPTNGWELTPGPPTFQSNYFAVRLTATGVSRFFRLRSSLPPDPATMAPPVDPTVATSLGAATEFLYAGPTPIQTGVAPGTIEARRAAVVRGKVTQRDSTRLPGVAISMLDQPELGQTFSRADGMFDMAVNGGGLLTVKYEKTGFCPVLRQINVPQRDYMTVPDVVMIPMDPGVTLVALGTNSPMQTHQASLQNDGDGTRRATIMFTPGTCANLVMANGEILPCSSLNIRATEFTVGTHGHAAMPAALPPRSGYTYCAELSADEAMVQGATSVQFDRPLPVYVENFLGFPVGSPVPAGYYDRQKGQWIASPDGRVIKVLTIIAGMADLDTDGDGAADDAATLTSLGVTADERARMAQLYASGQTLWRVPITHFSAWDFNWPFGPPPGAEPPPPPDGEPPPNSAPPTACGSIIGLEDQTLGEFLPVSGTPFNLHYQSERTPGRKDHSNLSIRLSGMTLPASLKRIDLEVRVAGQSYLRSFSPTPNLTHTYTFDGKDSYGRVLRGRQPITVRIGYAYPGVYMTPSQRTTVIGLSLLPAFGHFSYLGSPASGNRERMEVTLWREYGAQVDSGDQRTLGLGGWSLNVHHAYDPDSRALLLGDGRQRSAQAMDPVITTVAGISGGANGDGGPATEARLNGPFGAAAGPDGSLYIVERDAHRIRRVGLDGIITTTAGIGSTSGFGGDGGPATQARLRTPVSVAVAVDGSLYIGDEGNWRIRRVGTDGIITTVAGNGTAGYSGDGGPATQASITNPYDVAVAPDGSLYIADFSNNRVRWVRTDGIITTIAGNGSANFSGDGGPATGAGLKPSGIAVAPDGCLYIVDRGNHRIRRVGLDGIITTVAGNGIGGFSGDGGPATQARINNPFKLAVTSDGSVYIGDQGSSRIRRVGPDGIITTIAGNGTANFSGDGGPAPSAGLSGWLGVALTPNGGLFVVDQYNNRIRRVAAALPDYAVSAFLLASEDGRELYTFNSAGRHLKTLDALSGAVDYQFGYDSKGYLTSITDANGNVTTVQRSGAVPLAIVAPDGQRTALSVSTDGWLTQAANPAGEAHILSYSAEGLLQRFIDPRGNIHAFTYDARGLLIRDQDPAGGSTSLARSEQSNGFTITTTSALGRTRAYQADLLPTGAVRRSVTQPNGVRTVTVINTDGSEQTTYGDGSVTTVQYGPDPRWGMLARLPRNVSATTGGRTSALTTTLTATLSDPNNLLSLTNLRETVTVNGRTFTSVYDAATRTVTSTTAAGRQGKAVLDSLGRVVQLQVTGLLANNVAYDPRGRLASVAQGTGIVARTTILRYNTNGYLDTVTDPLSRTLSLAYDGVGRVTRQTLPDGREILYGYDPSGNVTSLTPPGRPAHQFGYTPVDLQRDYTPPAVGAGSNSTHHAYDPDKELTRSTRPDGQILDYGYDNGGACNCGRLTTLTLPTGVSSFAYDATTGRLTGITTPGGGTLSYTYTGALLAQTTWAGTVAGNVSRTYDNDFRVASISVNGVDPIAFRYDADSLLTNAGSLRLIRNAQNGLLTSTTLGNVTDSIGYDGFGEATNYSASYNGSEVFKTLFSYDKLGRVVTRTETVEGTTTIFEYGYDLANRLREVQKNGTVTATYAYDSNGNRLTAPGLGTAPIYDDQDRLIEYGGATYSYTANGELKSKTNGALVTAYDYDVLGNLKQVSMPNGTNIDYIVDGQNRRVGKKVNGVLVQGFFYQDSLKPIAELDGANQVVSRFVYATGVNVPDYIIKGGVAYRLITDQLGSPRLVIEVATGTVIQRLDYDEFGNVVADTNPGFQPFGFAGGLFDQDTKLVRFGARDYDAKTGRWTAKDPILFAGHQANLYAYVTNDPLNRRDPGGLDDSSPFGDDGSYLIFPPGPNCPSSCGGGPTAATVKPLPGGGCAIKQGDPLYPFPPWYERLWIGVKRELGRQKYEVKTERAPGGGVRG